MRATNERVELIGLGIPLRFMDFICALNLGTNVSFVGVKPKADKF